MARPHCDTLLVGLAYHQGKDIAFRFIIEYIVVVMDFGPSIIGLFLYEDFKKMTFFGLC